MSSIFEALICSSCTTYLSVFPIKVYPNLTVKCGRCNFNDDGGTVSKLYETLAEQLKFPCINCYEGCKKWLPPNKIKLHENSCLGTWVQCPNCSNFQGHSFAVVEHFKVEHPKLFLKHPEFVIAFNDKNEDKYYLYASLTENMLGIIYQRYDHLVKVNYLHIAPIYIEGLKGKKLLQKYEVYNIHNELIFKSPEKRCATYICTSGFHLNGDGNGEFIQGCYPGDVGFCKFSIKEDKTEVPDQNLEHSFKNLLQISNVKHEANVVIQTKEVIKHVMIPCNQNHFPIPGPVQVVKTTCKLEHLIDNPVMMIDSNNTATQTIYIYMDIRSLTENNAYSPLFYLANTSWKFCINKYYEGNYSYLSCYFVKVDDKYQNKFSYKIEVELTILSDNEDYDDPDRYLKRIVGKRQNEYMAVGFQKFMPWHVLVNPRRKFIDNEDSIAFEAEMTLIKILNHKDYCQCPGCLC